MSKHKDNCLPPQVLQINNQECPTLFHRVTIPAEIGDDETYPPKPGLYRNTLLVYDANKHVYMFSSDGIPTFISDGGSGVDDYNELTNKPSIDGHELVGDSSLDDIGVTDAIEDALEDYTPTSELAEVAFTGDYDDLENTPTPTVTHFYLVPAYTAGSPSLVYNDSAHTSQTTYQEFQNAILSGPVQIHQEYDVDTYWISNIALTDIWLNEYISFYVDAEQWRGLYRWDSTDAAPLFQGSQDYYSQVQADWNVTNTSSSAYIKNKPTLATVATSGSYDDLTDKPDIPSGLHIFYMLNPSVGNAAPIYHDYGRTDQVTLAQFTDAIASGPVQIYIPYDGNTFRIHYVDQMDAFIPDPPMATGTLYVNFGLRDQHGLGVRRFLWYEPDTAPIFDSYESNQSDWNETSSTNSSYIKNKPNLATVATSGSYNDLSNKPTIPAAQVNSDWNASSGVAQILNKPTLAAVATSGNYDDLSNKPTIPAAQVNSDWNAASGVAQILNKPSLATVATSGSYNDLSNKPTIPTVNDATLTINQNGTSAGTFTANASSNTTINLTDTTYSDFSGATSSAAGAHGLVPAPSAGDQGKVLHGDGTWKDAAAKLVEMSYGESNAWAKFIAAYNAGSIVYCRASSNANPATGSQTRKAFMAYVNNAESPTSVEFQYVRSVSSKSASQPVDQVFVYTLTNASGGTWTVASRNMAPKLAAGTNTTVSYSNGTYTISATGGGSGPTVVQTTGQSTTSVMSQKAVTDIIGDVETILQTLNSGNGAQQ